MGLVGLAKNVNPVPVFFLHEQSLPGTRYNVIKFNIFQHGFSIKCYITMIVNCVFILNLILYLSCSL